MINSTFSSGQYNNYCERPAWICGTPFVMREQERREQERLDRDRLLGCLSGEQERLSHPDFPLLTNPSKLSPQPPKIVTVKAPWALKSITLDQVKELISQKNSAKRFIAKVFYFFVGKGFITKTFIAKLHLPKQEIRPVMPNSIPTLAPALPRL